MKNSQNLTGKKIFISGGSRGIGFNFAKTLLISGASVAFCGRDKGQLIASHRALQQFIAPNNNQRLFSYETDISKKSEVNKLKSLVYDDIGAIDVLISNAAVIGPLGSFLDNDLDFWESTVKINLMGSIYLIHNFLPIMINNGGGKIIQISGGGATTPLPNVSSYAASKTAIVRFIESVALEYKNSNVQINAVAPGIQKTRINNEMIEAGPNVIGDELYSAAVKKSLDQDNSTQKACDLIKFLASEESNGITGKLISAEWDNWAEWPKHISELQSSKLYTLRRYVARGSWVQLGRHLMLNAAVIGCGAIGKRRAKALEGLVKIVSCTDIDSIRSNFFAENFNCDKVETLKEILENKRINIVFIATIHEQLAGIALQCLKSGKHVFIEKPGAVSFLELEKVRQEAVENNLMVRIGYNHRYHPAIRQALKMFSSGDIGNLLFVRGRYGHGGRIGYEKEWRSKKRLSGGGELIDQGTHLLDLSIAFLGDVTLEYSATPNYFWNMEVEDNVFMSLKNKVGSIAFLHASCTEWKNTFSLEIYGETGKIEVSGLGGSYGKERLTYFKMRPEMGPPETTSWEFLEDDSWRVEVKEFIEGIADNLGNSSNIDTSIKVLKLVHEIYEKTGR